MSLDRKGMDMGYTPEWWQREGKKVAAKRRKKYANDKDYREAAKARSREYREQKKLEREAFYASPYLELNGEKVAALTVDTLCSDLGIDKSRLKYMQKAGYIPTAIVSRPVRLYTEAQRDRLRELEAFLQKNSAHLRVPNSEAGVMATANLETLIATIKANWKN